MSLQSSDKEEEAITDIGRPSHGGGRKEESKPS